MDGSNNKSELARLLQQIDMQNEAAYLSLHGLASGTSQHAIITAKMERWGRTADERTGRSISGIWRLASKARQYGSDQSNLI